MAGVTRRVLLVEDSEGDAELVSEYLAGAQRDTYEITHAGSMEEAVSCLATMAPDAILCDLRLPDSVGADSVRRLHGVTDLTPIIVLTGIDDEQLALDCIDAGAQDYLTKADVQTRNLERAIGYAISRHREAELRELRQTVERYRTLGSQSSRTLVTSVVAGMGPVKDRRPDRFEDQVLLYRSLLRDYFLRQLEKRPKPRAAMERLVNAMGDLGAGPRDMVDLHLAALDNPMIEVSNESGRSLIIEGRLMALEMMGLLVDYYRTGLRRGEEGGDET
ncbi:response regulator [Pseudoroseicyclus sp. CXY001]|uniref:response regulator n=1 Tax=Pseudoroseicyclus sp. CXY001 TaxID=3242492 RepID=UPI00357169A0